MHHGYIVVSFFLGAAILLLLWWPLRWLFYSMGKKKLEAAVEAGARQMRRTAILVQLGSEPREIKALQRNLRLWGYAGMIDGAVGPATIASFESYATHNGIDLDEAARRLIKRCPDEDKLPAQEREKLILRRAVEVVQAGIPAA